MVKWISSLLAFAALVFCLGSEPAEDDRTLTLLVYMSGSDLESRGGAAS